MEKPTLSMNPQELFVGAGSVLQTKQPAMLGPVLLASPPP
jgi:hypothetical protein